MTDMTTTCKSPPVLHVALVQHILVHGDFRSVEHAGLVHVVPYVQVLGAALVLVRRELRGPPGANLGAGHIKIGGGAWRGQAVVAGNPDGCGAQDVCGGGGWGGGGAWWGPACKTLRELTVVQGAGEASWNVTLHSIKPRPVLRNRLACRGHA
jgi:hypothetical protein